MNIGIIGAGNMGGALAKGLISGKVKNIGEIFLYDVDKRKTADLKKEINAGVSSSIKELLKSSDIIVIAVKPGIVASICGEIAAEENLYNGKIFISIAAGVAMSGVERAFENDIKLARVMPNTPLLIGKGVSGIAFNTNITDTDRQVVVDIFESVGSVFIVDEDKIDIVTGLSGSGPAYVFLFIKALADGGIKNGLPVDIAVSIATDTVLGAAALVKASGEHPEVLKDRVTSPGGTTISGLMSLEKGNIERVSLSSLKNPSLFVATRVIFP